MFFLLIQNSKGQNVQVPKNYVLKTEADFKKYEADVINCVQWIESVPIDQDLNKHKEVYAFLVAWIYGCPYVSVEVNSNISKLTDKNKDLLAAYIGGWTKYVLENPESKNDTIKGYAAGITSLIKVYQMGGGIVKDKDVEGAAREYEKGMLEKYVQEKILKY